MSGEESKAPQVIETAVAGEPQPQPQSAAAAESPAATAAATEEERKKWGTDRMGYPAAPSVHPDNKKAALWKAAEHQKIYHQELYDHNHLHPYVQTTPVEKPSSNPFEPVIHMFNSWSNKAETIARNIWHNLKTGPSVSEAAWGKLNLTAKAITEGGFESLFKQTFPTQPNEKLKKTFACYLSTSTGPVAGTLYLSSSQVAFCSDRPLYFTAPSGQQAWSYYKVMIPLPNIAAVKPVTVPENSSEKYLQIITGEGHEFWFMGFVSFEKAMHHISNAVST